MTKSSEGRGRDRAAPRSSGAAPKRAAGSERTARRGGAAGGDASARRVGGQSSRGKSAGRDGTRREPAALPLLGPDDERPYRKPRDTRDSKATAGKGKRPLGDRAQSGVRRRSATGSTGAPPERERSKSRRGDAPRGRDPRSGRREGEVTGPFTRRRETPAVVEEKRPVLRYAATKPPAKSPAKRSSAKRDAVGADGRTAAKRTRNAAPAPAKNGGAPRKRRPATEATEELRRQAGGNANRAVETLVRATDAFTRGRERDALRILRPLTEAYPAAAAVRELAGLCRYRIGSYGAAADDLAAFADLSGSTEQHPVLMDCRRAQGRLRDVEELWEELRETSPSAALVTEGRIVLAGALADAGRLADAIDMLARRADVPGRTKEHTVRLWYALADLEERAGDVPRARALFEQVQRFDGEFADVAERLAALS